MAKYFTFDELERSAKATQLGIENKIPRKYLANAEHLMEYLDKVREAYGKPIRISSGYRSPQLNALVGGVAHSQHMQGLAADLVVPDMEHLMAVIRKLGGFDQLIDERPKGRGRWVHVSIAPEGGMPRGKVMRYDGRHYVVIG